MSGPQRETKAASAVQDDAILPAASLDATVQVAASNDALPVFHISVYARTFAYNTVAFLLPCLYRVLSLLWTSRIDTRLIATTNVYTYIGDIVDVFNNGLPRAAFHVIGNAHDYTAGQRAQQACTLIATQTLIGTVLTVGSIAGAPGLLQAFVPQEARSASLEYVQLSAGHAFTSALETAVATSTRSLDLPEIPAGISTFKFVVNVALDLLLVSPFHVGSHKPTVNTQAAIRLACDMASALLGLAAFVCLLLRQHGAKGRRFLIPRWRALRMLLKPAAYLLTETAVRMVPFLWLTSSLIQSGIQIATAWSILSVLTWGVFLVPVQAAEASSAVYVAHLWAIWRRVSPELGQSNLRYRHVREFLRPAITSFVLVAVIESLLYIGMSLHGAEAFARWTSHDNAAIAPLVSHMWQTIGWAWILYSLYTTIAAVYLAASPRLYLIQSAVAMFVATYPCAIAAQVMKEKMQLGWTQFGVWFAILFAAPIVSAACAMPLWLRALRRAAPLNEGGATIAGAESALA